MFIAVEGCIGAGKSTVVNGLAAYRGSFALLEAFEANPFLRDFATDPAANALETEFAFLLIHFHQLKSVRSIAGSKEVLADFHLAKDLLYERMNIVDARARELFEALYDVCVEQIPRLDLLVCLSAPSDLILDRIRARQREFELTLDPDYYIRLNELYEEYFQAHTGAKILVRMDPVDFCASPKLLHELSTRIDRELAVRPSA
jgi:deoxyguanosine kinase